MRNNKKGSAQVGLVLSIIVASFIIFTSYTFKQYLASQQEIAKDKNLVSEYVLNSLSEAYLVSWEDLKDKKVDINGRDLFVKYEKGEKTEYNTDTLKVTFDIEKKSYSYQLERSGYNAK